MFRLIRNIVFYAFLLVAAIFCIANYYSDKSVEELKSKYGLPGSKYVNIDDMPVHYVDEGNPADSLPLVLLHGTGSNLRTWDGWIKTINGERRTLRLDLPAYGLTGPNSNHDYSTKRYVQFLHDFLKKINVSRCYLAGNSLGGKIAWEYALAYPQEVSKLILIDAAGYPMPNKAAPMVFRLAKNRILSKIFLKVTPKFIIKKSLLDVYADDTKVTDSLVDQYHDMATREGIRAAFLSKKNNDATKNYLKINSITQPTLVLWGDADNWITPDNAYKFQKDLPNDTLIIYKNVGHVPMEEYPTKSANDVLDFLKKSDKQPILGGVLQ
jgi:pimeloyl-ACP methyl ester carboxylesterase